VSHYSGIVATSFTQVIKALQYCYYLFDLHLLTCSTTAVLERHHRINLIITPFMPFTTCRTSLLVREDRAFVSCCCRMVSRETISRQSHLSVLVSLDESLQETCIPTRHWQ